jgi:hypothetical protein
MDFWEVLTGWTDENGFRQSGSSAEQNSSNGKYAVVVARDLAGQPLLYATKTIHGESTPTYNLFIVVEQLQ